MFVVFPQQLSIVFIYFICVGRVGALEQDDL